MAQSARQARPGPEAYPPFNDSLTPEVLDGKITIGKHIGTGEYSMVLAGELCRSGDVRLIALKVFFAGTNQDHAAIREAVRREIKIVQGISHPNLLSFRGLLKESTEHFHLFEAIPALVSDLCEGGAITEYLSERPNTRRLPLMFQVALGIEYLHKNQILHGDIKPENILIAKDADQVKAVVAGFGKSTVQNHPGYTTELAPSFLYTAPELMDYIGLAVGTVQSQLAHDEFGDVLLTPAADIYAFGLTILTVISGKRPLYQFNPFNAPFRLGYQNERPLRRDHPSSELSDILWNLICACWQVAPQARPNAPYVADVLWSDMDT